MAAPRLKVLSVASEVFPLIKTGGLADVAGALPGALAKHGVSMLTLLPLYPAVAAKLGAAATVHRFTDFYGGEARLLAAVVGDLDLLLLDAPHLFERPGNPYVGADGRDWPDNALRFAALSRAAAAIGQGLLRRYQPDVLHCHDWQAGLAPAFLHYDGGYRPRTMVTVHNLAFQGQFPRSVLESLGLPPRAFTFDGVEYYGSISFLKAGLQFADRITTVSPTYAQEILSPEAGMGLDGLLNVRGAAVSGILNGIDLNVWNPATDKALVAPYDAKTLEAKTAKTPDGKALGKAALQKRMGLEVRPGALLYGVVSRLSWQKGLDLVLETLPELIASGAQLAILGAGEAALEGGFRAAAQRYPGKIACEFGYDEGLAHQIQAGSDAILVPSRFEPCGLTQLCALRYGSVPVVSRVGGLADTIIDANEMALNAGAATGVVFQPVTAAGLTSALRRAASLYARPAEWRSLRRAGMRSDVSWAVPARRYADLYRSLATKGA